MSGYLKLPLSFDIQRLQGEVADIGPDAWIEHFNTDAYEGHWSCVPLRSAEGRSDHIMPLVDVPYVDTPWLQRSAYLREVIASFQCEKTSVRLMALAPGAQIREHRDPGTAIEEGITRVHVPIQTCAQALFRIDGETVHFSAGDAWYLNATSLHGVENRGERPRVHLMLDCVTNEWLRQLFRAAGWQPRYVPSPEERALLAGRVQPYSPGQSLRGWFPVTLGHGAGGQPSVGWRCLDDRPLSAAFFEDDLRQQPSAQRRTCHTPVTALEEFHDSVAPSAFLFHVSRCGSTLLTQMLATLPHCIVLSEPPALDAFFRLHHREPQACGASLLRGLLAALGQRRTDQEQHCIVKLDSWHLPWIPWLRAVYPDTPLVLLYRDPAQVFASHLRQRGRQMVPGLLDTSRLQPDTRDLAPADLDGYALRMLDAVFDAGLQASATPGLTLVNYSELSQVLIDKLMPAWGIACSAAQRAQIADRSFFHSKNGALPFTGDPVFTAPQTTMDRRCRAVHCYEALEQRRLGAAAC